MISKNNMKYYIIVAFISIVLYKIIDSPSQILNRISGFISFFSHFTWNSFDFTFKSSTNVFREKI